MRALYWVLIALFASGAIFHLIDLAQDTMPETKQRTRLQALVAAVIQLALIAWMVSVWP